MKHKQGTLLRLSNRVVQLIFTDDTQIILSSDMKYVTYRDQSDRSINYLLASALESNNHDMKKRLVFTKEIMN